MDYGLGRHEIDTLRWIETIRITAGSKHLLRPRLTDYHDTTGSRPDGVVVERFTKNHGCLPYFVRKIWKSVWRGLGSRLGFLGLEAYLSKVSEARALGDGISLFHLLTSILVMPKLQC